ncbi:hypothetical protein QBC37DRAFT_174077 [Rhypophila decipiens]|uniref:Uncharacterized protein n=1 Tax=Rhypophila decipiens TaxID=261697 RepID=A0AAN6XUC2_9PEZI|nr:hypothetical protein QBC37DRAFT_174077 [Rhypophila decipiens]
MTGANPGPRRQSMPGYYNTSNVDSSQLPNTPIYLPDDGTANMTYDDANQDSLGISDTASEQQLSLEATPRPFRPFIDPSTFGRLDFDPGEGIPIQKYFSYFATLIGYWDMDQTVAIELWIDFRRTFQDWDIQMWEGVPKLIARYLVGYLTDRGVYVREAPTTQFPNALMEVATRKDF